MNHSSAPQVSVCMPVYNGSDYIADSVQSVLTQTYKDFNLIVCDNCSTDKTDEIIRSFKDPRLIYVRNNKNLGLVGNHNRCLELADGKYVHFLHHDDIMLGIMPYVNRQLRSSKNNIHFSVLFEYRK